MNTTTVWVIAGLAVLLLWLKGHRRPGPNGIETAATAPEGENITRESPGFISTPQTLDAMAEFLAQKKRERGINGF